VCNVLSDLNVYSEQDKLKNCILDPAVSLRLNQRK
jgi:hypothetical protein